MHYNMQSTQFGWHLFGSSAPVWYWVGWCFCLPRCEPKGLVRRQELPHRRDLPVDDVGGQTLFMYTLRMSRSSRALALSLTILWVVAPQMACFMPETVTESEHECCQQMANECGGSGMSHECCRTVVRLDVATLARANRDIGFDFSVAGEAFNTIAAVSSQVDSTPVFDISHASSDLSGTAPVILRI